MQNKRLTWEKKKRAGLGEKRGYWVDGEGEKGEMAGNKK